MLSSVWCFSFIVCSVCLFSMSFWGFFKRYSSIVFLLVGLVSFILYTFYWNECDKHSWTFDFLRERLVFVAVVFLLHFLRCLILFDLKLTFIRLISFVFWAVQQLLFSHQITLSWKKIALVVIQLNKKYSINCPYSGSESLDINDEILSQTSKKQLNTIKLNKLIDVENWDWNVTILL